MKCECSISDIHCSGEPEYFCTWAVQKDSEVRAACGRVVKSREISIYHMRPVGDVWAAPVYLHREI